MQKKNLPPFMEFAKYLVPSDSFATHRIKEEQGVFSYSWSVGNNQNFSCSYNCNTEVFEICVTTKTDNVMIEQKIQERESLLTFKKLKGFKRILAQFEKTGNILIGAKTEKVVV